MNMRVLFKYFNIQEGLDHIDKLMHGNAPDFQRWILAVYRNHESHGEWKIHYATVRPVRYMTRGGQAKYDHVEIKNDEGSFEIKSYFDQYFNQHKEKIDEEICKIKALIRTLE